MISVIEHPTLEVLAFETEFATPLSEVNGAALPPLLSLTADVPIHCDDAVRNAIRDLLRHTGYKPTGRGKPASEYLLRAVTEGKLSSINAAVDACNVASLHSGLPISVVDLDKATAPFSIRPGAPGEQYIFNAAGQTIDIEGLLCLVDSQGPTANAVKDAQRTKTSGATRKTLSIVWGSKTLVGRTRATHDWYRQLLHSMNATTRDVATRQ